jgi:hypothetical protein
VDKQQNQNKTKSAIMENNQTGKPILFNTDTTKLHLDAEWKRCYQKTYEVTRNADTERPLPGNTGIRMKKELLRCLR